MEDEEFSDEEEVDESSKSPLMKKATVIVHKDDVGDNWNFKVFFRKKEIEKTLSV